MATAKEINTLNLDMSCHQDCENCEKYFECTLPQKDMAVASTRMAAARVAMGKIKHKILVIGGKGGVGKSIVTANVATALAMKGKKVSILDQNFDGPAIPKMMGMEGQTMAMSDDGIIPGEGLLGIQVVSMGLILGEDEVLTWFHEMKRGATEEFLSNVVYGERDYLVVDIPAGTSSDTVNALAYIPDLDGALVVTVPSDVSQGVAYRAIKLCETAGIYPFGILENMSGFSCSKCGHKVEMFQTGGGDKLARETNTPFLGGIPLSTMVSQSTNEGTPFVYKYPEIEASKMMMMAADLVDDILEGRKAREYGYEGQDKQIKKAE